MIGTDLVLYHHDEFHYCEEVETDEVDLVDLRTVSPPLAAVIFENGILPVGAEEHAAELRRQLMARESDQQSSHDRLDAALDRIGDHLGDDDAGVPAAGETADDGQRTRDLPADRLNRILTGGETIEESLGVLAYKAARHRRSSSITWMNLYRLILLSGSDRTISERDTCLNSLFGIHQLLLFRIILQITVW